MRQARIAKGLLLTALLLLAGGPGFRSRKQFEEHFAKHGREFGNVTLIGAQGEDLFLIGVASKIGRELGADQN